MNPRGAAYCYFDGTAIDASPPPSELFPKEWTFAGRRPCRTIDELARGCLAEWGEAKNALLRREFQQFFRQIQREDLAKLVPSPDQDGDVALQSFLERLPAKVAVKPAIDVAPRRLHFANLRKGPPRTVMLQVINRGSGLLAGQLSLVENVRWLKLSTTKLRARPEQAIELTIDPAELPGAGSFFAKLKVESNGGNLEVPVQADMTLSGIPFQGFTVSDPYDLAKVMLAHPKRAAKWMEDGSVARLFCEEGWDFPIPGPLAPSLGAVQQYFEAYRLSSIPKVSLSESTIDCTCEFPERITRSVTLTTAKKWIYASAESDAMWLKAVGPMVTGSRTVEVPFEVDSGLLQAGRVYEGLLRIIVNGGMELPLLVRADVRKPFEPWTRKLFRPFTG